MTGEQQMKLLMNVRQYLWFGILITSLLLSNTVQAQTYKYPAAPLKYPMSSDQYLVQYSPNGIAWTTAQNYISYYGGTNSSPWRSDSKYLNGPTSMSYASVPAKSNSYTYFRVTKLHDGPFRASDNPQIRPAAKGVASIVDTDGAVRFRAYAGYNFHGDQVVLWWNRSSTENAGVEGLAIFLTPQYTAPLSHHLLTVTSAVDLEGDLSPYDTLVIKGKVAVGGTGDHAFTVPANICTIYFEPGSWLQGKLAFAQNDGALRKVYGAGVIDASRFNYADRHDDGEQGYPALTAVKPNGQFAKLQYFDVEGITIVDSNFYSSAPMLNSSIIDVKVITWNGNNDGLAVDSNSAASNIFIRSGDDSIKVWGSDYTITNATVWQNYNGGCVNLGWSIDSPGDGGKIDGLYVVRTDWTTPASQSWTADDTNILEHQNNAVIASCMVPGTSFGAMDPPVFRNIFLDEAPWTLFSLKIIPPALYDPDRFAGLDLTLPSSLTIKIENLVSPQSINENSIGFQNIPDNYQFYSTTYLVGFTLNGAMDVHLKNVYIIGKGGIAKRLNRNNALWRGKILTNAVHVHYDD